MHLADEYHREEEYEDSEAASDASDGEEEEEEEEEAEAADAEAPRKVVSSHWHPYSLLNSASSSEKEDPNRTTDEKRRE